MDTKELIPKPKLEELKVTEKTVRSPKGKQEDGEEYEQFYPEIVAALPAIIEDELTAVSEYSALSLKFMDPTLRMLIMSIAGDEYGHARTFQALLTLLSEEIEVEV